MTMPPPMLSAWDWSPSALGLPVAALLGYLYFKGPLTRRAWSFFAGLFLLGAALVSPLGALAEVLFCAHMVKHLLLLLIVPPLMLLGLPPPRPPKKRALKSTGAPAPMLPASALFWLAGVGGMWLWHIPALCNAAMTSAAWHALETASSLFLGFCFWWPIVGPQSERRLAPLPGIFYLFSACVGCTLLGIFITFAPDGLYSSYLNPMDPIGILPWARERWGLTPAVDRQIGGLMMWVPACFVYVGGCLGLMSRWYASRDADDVSRPVEDNHE
jgi:putative membrane protein